MRNLGRFQSRPGKMILSSRQNGLSSWQQRQQAHLDTILFVTARAFLSVQKTCKSNDNSMITSMCSDICC